MITREKAYLIRLLIEEGKMNTKEIMEYTGESKGSVDVQYENHRNFKKNLSLANTIKFATISI